MRDVIYHKSASCCLEGRNLTYSMFRKAVTSGERMQYLSILFSFSVHNVCGGVWVSEADTKLINVHMHVWERERVRDCDKWMACFFVCALWLCVCACIHWLKYVRSNSLQSYLTETSDNPTSPHLHTAHTRAVLCKNVRVGSVTLHAKYFPASDSLPGLTWLIRLSSLASFLSLVSSLACFFINLI